MTEERDQDKTPLRRPTTVELIGIRDHSTPYRRIFKSIGLGTPAALYHFFNVAQANMRRAGAGIKSTTLDLNGEPVEAPADPITSGFEVEMIEEDPDGEINPARLEIGKLIVGDETIAAYDVGYNVFVAVREDSCIVVYNLRDIFLIAIDERRLQFCQAVAPQGNTTYENARAGVLSGLASLLGLGYTVTPVAVMGEPYIAVRNRIGIDCALPLKNMAGLLQAILRSDPSRAADPEWVFYQISKAAEADNNKKQVQA